MLDISQLSFERNDKPIFAGINFTLNTGEVLQVVGPNGAGKTTLLRVLCGLLTPSAGEIRWQGQGIHEHWYDYVDGMIYCSHQPALKQGLTVLENLRLYRGVLRGRFGDIRSINKAMQRVGLAGYENTLVQSLSAGQKRRVILAILLLAKTQLWLLDEPLTALDQAGVKLTETLIAEFVAKGGMVIFTSHQPIDIKSNTVFLGVLN